MTGYRFNLLFDAGVSTQSRGWHPAARHPAATNSDGSVNSDGREKKQTPYANGRSSFVSSLSPSRKEREEDQDHDARRQHWLDRAVALGLRVSKVNPVVTASPRGGRMAQSIL